MEWQVASSSPSGDNRKNKVKTKDKKYEDRKLLGV